MIQKNVSMKKSDLKDPGTLPKVVLLNYQNKIPVCNPFRHNNLEVFQASDFTVG